MLFNFFTYAILRCTTMLSCFSRYAFSLLIRFLASLNTLSRFLADVWVNCRSFYRLLNFTPARCYLIVVLSLFALFALFALFGFIY